jgi:hypothetical protein
MKPVLLAILLLTGCSRKNGMPDCTPEARQYIFQTGKTTQVDTMKTTAGDTAYERYAYQIKKGPNLVFTYTHQFQDCREIADDEQTDKVVFEIPAAATAITWKDSAAFQQGNVFYHQIGAWGTTPTLVKSGTLEGHKISNNRWHIKASLETSGLSRTVSFDHDFTP